MFTTQARQGCWITQLPLVFPTFHAEQLAKWAEVELRVPSPDWGNPARGWAHVHLQPNRGLEPRLHLDHGLADFQVFPLRGGACEDGLVAHDLLQLHDPSGMGLARQVAAKEDGLLANLQLLDELPIDLGPDPQGAATGRRTAALPRVWRC